METHDFERRIAELERRVMELEETVVMARLASIEAKLDGVLLDMQAEASRGNYLPLPWINERPNWR